MRKETAGPSEFEGTATKNDPRRYRTLSPHLEGFWAQDAEDSIPPAGPPFRGTAGGFNFGERREKLATIGGRGEPLPVAVPKPCLPGTQLGESEADHGRGWLSG